MSNSKIQFSIHKNNLILGVVIHLFRPELDRQLDKIAMHSPKEFSSARFGLIEKNNDLREINQFLSSLGARNVVWYKILGVISCDVESENLEKIARHDKIKTISLHPTR